VCKPRILIVDDHAGFRGALRLALVVKGYDISEAGNADDALKTVRSESPDLILLDWLMPGTDGLAFCRAFRAASQVPIIMVTSKQESRFEALAAGANDYLTKPFGIGELLTHIETLLGPPATISSRELGRPDSSH